MKKILSLLTAGMLLASLAACGGDATTGTTSTGETVSTAAADTGDTIKIGGIGPLTGSVSQYGQAALNGAQLAIDDINAKGGILGKQVEFIVMDDKGDAAEATNAYDSLVHLQNVSAIIGPITTKPTLAVAQLAAQDGIPLITPSATGAEVTEIGSNIFRTCFTDPYQGELLAHYIKDELAAVNAAVIYDSGDDYSTGIANAFVETAESLNIEITNKEGYQTGAKDFNVQLTNIKAGDPDVIIVPTYYGDASQIVSQARALGIDVPLLGGDGWDGILDQIDASNYSMLEGCTFFSQYSDNEPSESLAKFLEDYRAKYGQEMMFSVLGYEAVGILAQAMDAAGTTDSEAVVAAIKDIEYTSLAGGSVTYPGEVNDPVRDAYIVGFTDGEYNIEGVYTFSATA